MATFKIGQRVRINYTRSPFHGREATIWEINHDHPTIDWDGTPLGRLPIVYRVDVVGHGRIGVQGKFLGYEPQDLLPLTDPKADQFIESIKRLKPYEEPKVLPVKTNTEN